MEAPCSPIDGLAPFHFRFVSRFFLLFLFIVSLLKPLSKWKNELDLSIIFYKKYLLWLFIIYLYHNYILIILLINFYL